MDSGIMFMRVGAVVFGEGGMVWEVFFSATSIEQRRRVGWLVFPLSFEVRGLLIASLKVTACCWS